MNFDKYISPLSEEKLLQACARIRHVALDMDGTIYLGSTLFPYTQAFLQTLRDNGISYSFLTNNPTKSSKDYLSKLQRLGIDATEEQMYTSSIATIDYIRMQYPKAKRIFTLGTPSMQAEFVKAGFKITSNSADDVPDVLVVAFDTTLEYSLCKAIEGATKRRPDIVIGKPNPNMLYCIRDKYGLRDDEIAMVGDRIYTDVATAQNAGSFGVLVLSGETTLEVSLTYERQPDLTALSIKEFGELLQKSRQK